MIDWLRVDMVCNGTRLSLTPDEKRMVLRRLAPKMMKPGDSRHYAGKLTTIDVAHRLDTTDRSVMRLMQDMPAADKHTCPVCREPMWVVSGVVEAHPDSLLQECPLSGQPNPEGDWEERTALTVRWLAERIRAGDAHGVAWTVDQMERSRVRELLVAALAAVPVDKPVEEWFSWLEEIA